MGRGREGREWEGGARAEGARRTINKHFSGRGIGRAPTSSGTKSKYCSFDFESVHFGRGMVYVEQ